MTEGEFPKVAGDVLYASEANKFSQANNLGLAVLKPLSAVIWDDHLRGLHYNLYSGTSYENINYNPLNPGSIFGIDTVTSNLKIPRIMSMNILDDFTSGTNINTNLWVNSGAGEITIADYGLAINPSTTNRYVVASQGSGVNFQVSGATIFLRTESKSTTGVPATITIRLGSGLANTTIKTLAPTSPTVNDYRIQIHPGKGSAWYWENDMFGNIGSTGVNLSSLVASGYSNWYLRLEGNNAGGETMDMRFKNIGYLLSGIVSKDFISYGKQITGSITNAILVEDHLAGSSAAGSSYASYYLSADSGLNWEQVTPFQLHDFTNVGSNLRIKATITSTRDNIYQINHLAAYCNLY